jgi:hypothetical protein
MKTAREIILERHGSASSALDSIRRQVVDLNGSTTSGWRYWAVVLQEQLFSWRTLAAIWVTVAALNLSTSNDTNHERRKSAQNASTVALGIQDSRYLLSELLAPPPHTGQSPQPALRPRSQIIRRLMIA